MSEDQTSLSYYVKYRRRQPVWQGPIVWDRPDPEIGDEIEIDGALYRVLDVGITDPGRGWTERHIAAYVDRVKEQPS